MTFRCPVCYYLKTHFKGRICNACSKLFEEKPDGKIKRKNDKKEEPKENKKDRK